MKHILILILTVISYQYTYSQSSFSAGVGYYLWGSGDLRVPTIELEFRKDLSSLFSMGLSADFGHYSSLTNEDVLSRTNYTFTSFSSKQLIILNLFNTDLLRFSFMAGSSIRYYHQLLLSPPWQEDPFSQEGTFTSNRHVVYGAHIRPEIHFNLSDKNKITLATSTTIYTKSQIFSGFSLSFMHQLGE